MAWFSTIVTKYFKKILSFISHPNNNTILEGPKQKCNRSNNEQREVINRPSIEKVVEFLIKKAKFFKTIKQGAHW